MGKFYSSKPSKIILTIAQIYGIIIILIRIKMTLGGIAVLKIAYCDDEKNDRDIIMYALSHIEEKWNEIFEISPFNSGENLCTSLGVNSYDIILLDILMTGIDGIQTAKNIRALGEDSKIIFISSCDDKLRDLFRVGTIAFLDKPLNTENLEQALIEARDIIKKDENNIFTYKVGKDSCFIPLNDIKYFESNKHEIHIHTNKNTIAYYGTLKMVLEQIGENIAFVCAHKSYIVNFKYSEIVQNSIKIKGSDANIPISRGKREDILDKYISYMQRRSTM